MNKVIKEIFDRFSSLIGLIILSPILIFFAIWIKIDSKGPVFFKQERLGKDGKIFSIFKFRTMIVNAEKIGDGLSIKSDKDPRITKLGRFLRKTSIDELPQLINVLIGDMSLVGPRPPVVYSPYDGYENYPDWAKKRFEMKPGVTGLAQIKHRNSVTWNERIVVDNEYIDKFNFWLDIKIIFKTFLKLFDSETIY